MQILNELKMACRDAWKDIRELCMLSYWKARIGYVYSGQLYTAIPDYADIWGIDLVLSGHLHGGQVIIPGLGGLYNPLDGFFAELVSIN